MPEPTLGRLLRDADACEAAQGAAYAEYTAERSKVLGKQVGKPVRMRQLSGTEVQHIGDDVCREVQLLANRAQGVIKGPGCIGGTDSEAALVALRGEAAALRVMIDRLACDAGAALRSDLTGLLEPIDAAIALLEYWHLRFPKANGRVVLPSGKELYRIDDHGSLCLGPSARIACTHATGGTSVTFTDRSLSVPVYTESAEGDLLSFNPEAVAPLRAFFSALLHEMGLGHTEDAADAWSELCRYLGGANTLCGLLATC